MAEIIRMPKLSDTMTEGVVAKWYKNIGDSVKSGESHRPTKMHLLLDVFSRQQPLL